MTKKYYEEQRKQLENLRIMNESYHKTLKVCVIIGAIIGTVLFLLFSLAEMGF